MPNPTVRQVHVDAALTNLTLARLQDEASFSVVRALPFVGVQKRSDQYFIWDAGDLNRNEMRLRAPHTKARRVGPKLSTDSYKCLRKSVAYALNEDVIDNSDIDIERGAESFLSNQMSIELVQQFITAFFNTAIWTTDLTGVAAAPGANQFLQWDQAGSDPLAVVEDAKFRVAALSGKMPNMMVAGARANKILLTNDAVTEVVKYTSQAGPQAIRTELSQLFGLEYFAAQSIQTTSEKGQADTFAHHVPDNDVWLGYVEPNAAIDVESALYAFAWTGKRGVSEMGTRVTQYFEEDTGDDVREGDVYVDMKVTSADLGVFLDDAVDAAA